MVTLINHRKTESFEGFLGILFHGNGLDHGNHNIFAFNVNGFTL